MTVQLWLIFCLDWWFGFLKGIVTYGYPDSNPKPPITLQGTNISHLGKKENHRLTYALSVGYANFLEGNHYIVELLM